jgi:hypothetical protein
VTLSNKVTYVGYAAFANCENLTNLNFNEGFAANLNEMPFGNIRVTNLVIPSTLKTVSYSAFSDNPSLKEVVFEEGVERIENHAFYNCSSVEKVELPLSLKYIGDEVFSDNSKLEIHYAGTGEEFGKIERNGRFISGRWSFSVVCSDGTFTF